MTTQTESQAPGSDPTTAPPLAPEDGQPPVYFARERKVYRSGSADGAEASLTFEMYTFSCWEDTSDGDADADAEQLAGLLNAERRFVLDSLAASMVDEIRMSVIRLPLTDPARTLQMTALVGLAMGLARVIGFPGDLRLARRYLQERGIVIP